MRHWIYGDPYVPEVPPTVVLGSYFQQAAVPVNSYYLLSAGLNDHMYALDGRLRVYEAIDRTPTWWEVGSINTGSSYGVSYTYLSFVVGRTNTFFIAWDTVLYRSSDRGQTWTQQRFGVPNSRMISCLLRNKIGEVFVGTADVNDLFRSTDSGTTWEKIRAGEPGWISDLAFNSQGHILVGVYGAGTGIYLSTNRGTSWYKIYQPPTQTSYPKILSLSDNGNIYIQENGLRCSTDNGKSWTTILQSSYGIFGFNSRGDIFAPYYADAGISVKRSTDAGSSWSSLGISSLPSVEQIVFDSSDYCYIKSGTSLYRSVRPTTEW